MQRLLPAPAGQTTIEEAYSAPLGFHADRPWIGLCMVTSIDGSTVVDGTSSALSSDADGKVLSQLRSVADVIIVGAGTVRGEGYGPPKKDGQRIGVITRSGSVDTTTDLFSSGAGFVITTLDAEFEENGVDVIRAGTGGVDLREAIGAIPSICPASDFIQAEGGPTINGLLAEADLLDELDVTMSPGIVGGDGPRLTDGADDHTRRFELVQCCIDDASFMFTRWRRAR